MEVNSYLSPAFTITVDDLDITDKIASRLISLNLTECGSDESDQLDFTLSDADGMLAIPPRGTQIRLQLGWTGTGSVMGLIDKGTFTVDEVEHCGSPDQLILRARTVNLIDRFREIQEISFHDTTLGAIIDIIAFKNELQSGIADSLRDVVVTHLDQTRESDAAFLRRLGKQYDATATVKNNTLLFIPINQSTTASGQPLPTITLTRNQGDSHRYHSAERDSYTGVRVFWHDAKYALRRSVVAGSLGNAKRLRTTYATERDARQAAVAEWQRIQRGLATFELALAMGNPALIPKSPVQVVGFKETIDKGEWLTTKVSHCISKSGFTSRIEMETKTALAEVEREVETDPDEGVTGVLAEWKDQSRNKSGVEFAGNQGSVKELSHTFSSKQSAQGAANLEWAKITQQREAIAENNKN